MSKEAMKLALKRAFQYGVDHWYQADHDSYKENKKSNRTLAEFRQFVEKTCAALAEQPAQPSKPWVGLTEDEINKLMTDAARYRKLAAMERELVEPITIWHYLRNPYDLDNARAIGVAHCIKENT